jgi:hypothetical protein
MTTTETAYADVCRRLVDAIENDEKAEASGNAGDVERTSRQLAQADDMMMYVRGKWQQEHVKEVKG